MTQNIKGAYYINCITCGKKILSVEADVDAYQRWTCPECTFEDIKRLREGIPHIARSIPDLVRKPQDIQITRGITWDTWFDIWDDVVDRNWEDIL